MNQRTVLRTRAFTDEVLTPFRQQTDPPADVLIRAVTEAGGHAALGQLMRWLGQPSNASLDGQPEVVRLFFTENAVLPAFADWEKMRRGLQFFKKREGAIALMLGFLSLPYTYLGYNGVQVLMRSGRMLGDTRKRLEETGEFMFGLMNERAWPGGDAFVRCLKVRLIHAVVRWYTLNAGEAWDAPRLGQPVNQEDMAGTNLTFSWLVIKGLRRANLAPTEAEADDFLHLWNVIGFLNGVAEALLPQNLREAFVLDKAIARRQFRASDEGRALTKSLLRAIEDFIPTLSLKALPAAQMRFLLGDEHADWLGIPAVPLEKRLVQLVPIQLFSRRTIDLGKPKIE